MTDISWLSAVSGSFNTASDWSTDTVPGSADTAALTASGADYTVTSSVNNTINTLEAAANATLDISAGTFSVTNFADNLGSIEVGPGAALALGTAGAFIGFVNSGTIGLDGGSTAATAAKIEIDANFVLDDDGTLALSNSAHNEITGGKKSAIVQFENARNTIAGAGVIGDAYLTFVNAEPGTVDADDSTELEIVGAIGTIAAGTQTDTNDGLMETTGTGGLQIDSDMYNAGTVEADGKGALTFGAGSPTASPSIEGGGTVAAEIKGSTIDLDDATVQCAVVSTVAGSTIDSLAKTTNWLGSSELENAGTLEVAAGSTLNLNASVQNTGEIQLNGGTTAAKAADLLIYGNGAQLLSGGKLVLSNSAYNLIGTAASDVTDGETLINQDNLIEGAGTIGDANLRFINHLDGTVDSDDSAGLTLFGNTNANLESDYNDGLIENTGAGGLTIENAWSDGGTIEENSTSSVLDLVNFTVTSGGGYITDAVAGGVVNLTNVDDTDNFLDTVAGSTVNLTPGETSTISEQLYNYGTINVDSATLVASNNYYNYGTINLEGSGTASTIELSGQLELRGGGDLVLGNSAGNSIVSNGSAQTLDNVDNTISGFGTIGDTNITFENAHNATVDADGTSALTISTGTNEPYNAGTFESTNTGGLTVQGNLDNEGLLSSSAGNLDVTGNVDGFGVLNISGTGSIELGGYAYQDVTFESGGSDETLILDHSDTYVPNEIYGFGTGDHFDLRDIAFSASTSESCGSSLNVSTLTVTNGTNTANLYMIGSYSTSSFSLSSDSHGGTLVSFV
jgi:fibronectin-binding autotransporter adhesin